jgi:1A family penicillin-binding protein
MSRRKSFFNSLKWRILKPLLVLFISLGLVSGGILTIWFTSLKIPDLSAFETRKVSQSTKIFDRTGQILLYDVHADAKRTVVPFENISEKIKKASIAIEDQNFYKHKGIEPTSILRAIISNVTPGSAITQGGSTITQQVIKNSVLTKDKTITRKIKEWVLALKLEKILTKDQILYTYLNENPYGGSIYGVEEASKTFFGKSAMDVTLAEAAYIAAIPQAPTFFSPYGKNKDRLDLRKNLVLQQMLSTGVITKSEYDSAMKEVVKFLEKNNAGIRAPHFSLYVKEYLVNKYGESMVEEGGLKVTTTLDYNIQEKAEKVIKNFSPTLEKSFNASNTAMVAIDPKTGDILTMVGSRNYFEPGYGNFNIATAYRQPGSTFKPFVYATAFMKGYTPETILFDVKTEFSSQCTPEGKPKNPNDDQKICYSPDNYDGLFEGPEPIRKALAHSRNVPAVKALYLAGIYDSIRTARAMGITSLTDPDRYGLTLVLGGGEVSLLELTSAYGVFANDGLRNPYRSILKVEDADGKILEEASLNPSQAIPAQVARQITDILSDPTVRLDSITNVVENLRRQVATKTGTTNDFRDVWIQGYTPNIVVGAWAGKNDNTSMDKKVAGTIITPVWGAFMAEINNDFAKETFKKPDPTPKDVKPVLRGIWNGGTGYQIDTISKKIATDLTPQETRQDVIFPAVHTILKWVDKDNPNGPAPANPQEDSQYENWEFGVRNWFNTWKQSNPGFVETVDIIIPEAKDDIHIPENFPKVSLSISNKEKVVGINEKVSILVTSTGKFPLKKSELYINNKFISANEVTPNTISFIPQDIEGIEKINAIKVIVTDSVYNKAEASLEVVVTK